eukprot:c28430_g2_i1 orf=322-2022(-)
MDVFHKTGTVDHKHGFGTRKTAVRLFFFALILTFLHVTYVIKKNTVCRSGENWCSIMSKAGAVNFDSLPPLSTSYGSTALKLRHQFRSYEEYIQLQLNKTLNPTLKKLWTSRDWRRKVDAFSIMFQNLTTDEILKPSDKALCIGARVGQEVLALKEIGVQDAIGIDLVPSPPLVVKGDMHRHPFKNDVFDFEFSNVFDHALFPAIFASEIERTLKPGGYAVIHVSLRRRGDKYSANDLYSVQALVTLFKNSDVVHIRGVDAFGLDTEVVFKKRMPSERGVHGLAFSSGEGHVRDVKISETVGRRGVSSSCTVSRLKQKVIKEAEPLITEEPLKPWIALKQNLKNIRYLPKLMDIRGSRNYIYVDVGARNYGSSIGSWFRKDYPKQDQSFSIFALEPDTSFAAEYENRKNVKLLPYAAWIRNESLIFGVSKEQAVVEGERGMGRIQRHSDLEVNESFGDASTINKRSGKLFKRVQGMDFAEWLKQIVHPDDFIVVKMDIEGTEFDVLPRMFETGAICLVDELFLECHYNRWQRSSAGRSAKFKKTYGDCLKLFGSLRSSGVLVHQWW